MSERRVEIEDVLGRMNREAVPREAEGRLQARRSRVGRAIDQRLASLALAGARRARARRTIAWITVAAAVSLALALVLMKGAPRSVADRAVATLRSHGSVDRVRSGQREKIQGAADVTIEAADELMTPAGGEARALLSGGTSVQLEPGTSVRFEPKVSTPAGATEAVVLRHGAVSLEVPKLPPGVRLQVRTPDATVTVRGTRFRVQFDRDSGAHGTTVTVSEGSVWVSHQGKEVLLRPGAEWSSTKLLPATVVDSPPPAGPRTAASGAAGRAPGGNDHPEARADEPGQSTLGAENEQYHRAVSTARGGDDSKALEQLDAFIAKFPGSPLRENAKVERFRVLKRLGRTPEAALAARKYLAEYPSGFAREEARVLAAAALAVERP